MYSADEMLHNEDEAVQQEAARVIQRQWRTYQQLREDALDAQHNEAQEGGGHAGADGARGAARGGRSHVTFGGADADVSASSLLLAYDGSGAVAGMSETEMLLSEYKRLYTEWHTTRERNAALQHRLARHLAEQRHRKGEDVPPPPPPPPPPAAATTTTTKTKDGAGEDGGEGADDDAGAATHGGSSSNTTTTNNNNNNNNSTTAAASAAEQRYWAAIHQLHSAQLRLRAKQHDLERNIEHRRTTLQRTIDAAAAHEERLRALIAAVAARATFVRSNHTTIPDDRLRTFLDEDDALRCRIRDARVRHLQLQHHTDKLHRAARERDKRGDGMYLIDFEQLKIEKGSLQEKLEERNEDVVKLRGKVTTTIHILTHVKEKLEHVRSENAQLREQVAATEGELASVRDALAQMKRRRDGFVRANLRMREKMPLVGSEELLADYEQRKAVIHDTRLRVVGLTERHRQRMHCLRAQQPIIESLKHAISQYPT